MTMIDSAYQYYLSTYSGSSVSRYDTHKKSQLRDVYNRIVKINKDSPLYKFKQPENVKRYAIDLKESSRNIQNVVASLSDTEKGIEGAFSKKIAQSSDESVITASYIGNEETDTDRNNEFEIEVRQLARPQINVGRYLNPNRLDIAPGTYGFDLTAGSSSYEFQYNVSSSDTNDTLLHKLAKLVSTAGIGLTAGVISNDSGQVALQVSSKQTGIADSEASLFEIRPSVDTKSMSAMRTLGIDRTETYAANSSFILNGKECSSYSNTFTVNNMFDVTLKSISPDHIPTKVGFKANADAVADNVQELVDAYNGIIDIASQYNDSPRSNKLIRDIGGAATMYRNELEAIGLNIDSDHRISIDRSLLTDAVDAPDAKDNFALLEKFKNTLGERSAQVSIDPLNYANKIIVAYKNPAGRNLASPYITSIYSGMMLDRYC